MDVPNLMQRLSQHFVVLVGHTNVATRVATVDDAKHQAMDVDAPEMHACMHAWTRLHGSGSGEPPRMDTCHALLLLSFLVSMLDQHRS